MNCTCRTTALRVFIRNVAQFQVPVDATARRLPLNRSDLDSFLSRQKPTESNAPKNDADYESYSYEEPVLPEAATTEAATTEAATEPIRQQRNDARKPRPPNKKTYSSTNRDSRKDHQWSSAEPREPRRERRDPRESPRKQQQQQDQEEAYQQPKWENWRIQKEALKEKFPEGWMPRKRLSPDALAGIRALHKEFPQQYTTEVLANQFEVSSEAIRRILKSNWAPTDDEDIDRQRRWFNRGKEVWARWAELGKKPPTKWRAEGIVRDPKWNEPKVPQQQRTPEDSRSKARRQRLANLSRSHM
ncbi:hypothetical protein B0T17DRAFT_485246 [Bombardia bombarda]|uniref:Required for respiratory growth protein 9, mitochondrial n=1 Tax=Bombardia bombarda TaxID=252184 RepID=A0AA39XJ43_9PEZI|nr:hypothetical protein B0T17DRAFT_485246 [Bombardia bombarda]